MRKSETCYNVIFPIWFLLLFPIGWLLVLPANFIVDSMILITALKMQHIPNRMSIFKQSIIKVWIFGFTADMIGAALLFCSQMSLGDWWIEYITIPLATNPFDNWYALLFTAAAIALAALFIYFFNYKFSFYEIPLQQKQKKTIALVLALVTAPYLLLIPSQLIYNGENGNRPELLCFTNHFVTHTQSSTQIMQNGQEYSFPDQYSTAFTNGINTANQVKMPHLKETEPTFTAYFYSSSYPDDKTSFPFWQADNEQSTIYYFQYENKIYQVKEKYSASIASGLQIP